jgi:TolB protein
MRVVVASVGLALAVLGCAPAEPQPSPSTVERTAPSAPAPTALSPSAAPPSEALPDRPLAGSGSIAMVHADGSLWLVAADGRTELLASGDDGPFGFPAWSPDGARVAAVRSAAAASAIAVFDATRANTLSPPAPTIIFESAAVRPFYLSWTPDGESVSFLAGEGGTLSLRLAPADGSAPLDGSAPDALIRTGSPLYFDWVDADHLFAHIGGGPDAFLGEIDRRGASLTPAIGGPGSFRSVVVSSDGRSVGYVRTGSEGGADAVVVAGRDGAAEVTMPVFGPAALDFGPPGAAGRLLAAIGANEPIAVPLSIPVGPIRVLESGTGATRTLLEGAVVSFAWSPDGSTIAAIRVVPVEVAPAVSGASGSAAVTPQPVIRTEIRLTFVDVASGRIRSDPVVVPGRRYIDALMPYFDQYALSHRLWAPDSSSVLLPQAGFDGGTTVDVFFPDGGPPVALEGEIGFWSP